MTGFAGEDELYRYVGGIFETALADPELRPKLQKTGMILHSRCSEPDCSLVIDLPAAVVYRGSDPAAPAPSATMSMSTTTANAYWQGKVNLPFAMAKGTVKVEGSVTKLVQLAPLSKRLFPVYVERLRADGRDDLVLS
jgi:hypothetical protein